MKKKSVKIVAWVLTTILAVFVLFAIWYNLKYSMDPVESYTINSNTFENRLLLATQGSAFKDAVVAQIIDHYKNDSIFIQVVDVSSLEQIKPSDYSAIVILHTWEYDKAPKVVTNFVDSNRSVADKFIVLSTSGEGGNTLNGVDGIGGESIITDVPEYAMHVLTRLDDVLKYKE